VEIGELGTAVPKVDRRTFVVLDPIARAAAENKKAGKSLNINHLPALVLGGRCRVRTCDPCRVKAVLYR